MLRDVSGSTDDVGVYVNGLLYPVPVVICWQIAPV